MKTRMAIMGFIVATAFISCKKDKDKNANCRVVTITQLSGGTTTISNITYNNEGKVSTISTGGNGGSTKVFTYSGNTVLNTTTSNDGSFNSSDSITLDAKRRPLNIRQFSSENKQSWANNSFEYNGDELLKVHQTNSATNATTTSVAAYTNGNMISLTESSSTATLEYFTDKRVQQGDYLEIATFLQYGVTVYPHKNLLKSLSSGSSLTNFNYVFGNDGLISQLTATGGGSVATISYQYECR